MATQNVIYESHTRIISGYNDSKRPMDFGYVLIGGPNPVSRLCGGNVTKVHREKVDICSVNCALVYSAIN